MEKKFIDVLEKFLDETYKDLRFVGKLSGCLYPRHGDLGYLSLIDQRHDIHECCEALTEGEHFEEEVKRAIIMGKQQCAQCPSRGICCAAIVAEPSKERGIENV